MTGDANRARMLMLQYAPLLLFLLLLAVFGSLSDRFLTPDNFINIVTQAAHIAIIAIGMTFVLLVAGIDLSVGANMYASCIIVALYMKGWNPVVRLLRGRDAGSRVRRRATPSSSPACACRRSSRPWPPCSSAARSRSTFRA